MATKEVIGASLKVLGLAGLTGAAIVAPNATQGLSVLLKKSKNKPVNYSRHLMDLKRRGLIHVVGEEAGYRYTLTPAGAHRLQQSLVEELIIPIPKKWDKKWRLVLFDIPNDHNRNRAYFTGQLKNMGFTMVQKSVWAYPHPCFDYIEQVAGHYNVLRYCTLLEVGKMDALSAKRLIKHFDSILG